MNIDRTTDLKVVEMNAIRRLIRASNQEQMARRRGLIARVRRVEAMSIQLRLESVGKDAFRMVNQLTDDSGHNVDAERRRVRLKLNAQRLEGINQSIQTCLISDGIPEE
ncbi:hypothetical protein [Paraburkholderia antibiotica]|uniref:Uncharacterized protein n=1 Tax=Paraburkholderia antibiotica TaxID=2728839 RepID=A0A7X9X5F9_9BURK|nr:hypothetical protein [Paraburkholderia antibiotica]NML31813.1 hypothetical protein [Paraburkholderia antibiotica]